MKPPRWQLVLLAIVLIPCLLIGWRFTVDIKAFHYAAVVSHTDVRQAYVQPVGQGISRFFYGPVTLPLIYPLGFFSLEVARAIWLAVQCLAYFVFWRAIYLLYPRFRASPFVWWMAVIFSINPIHNNFQSNNVQLMLAAVLLCAHARRRANTKAEGWNGAVVSFVSAIKLYPAFIALYDWIVGTRRVRVGLLAGLGISILLPLVFFGPATGIDLFVAFFKNLTTYHGDNNLTQKVSILCLPSLIARVFSGRLAPEIIGRVMTLASLGGSLAYFGFVFLKRRALRANPVAAFVAWSLGLSVMVMVNPSSFTHYLIFYVPSVIVLSQWVAARGARRAPVVLALLLFGVASNALTTEAFLGRPWNDLIEFWNIPTLGLLALILGHAVVLKNTLKTAG